jgi:hypothetical protein
MAVAKFIVPDLRDKVDSGIGLWTCGTCPVPVSFIPPVRDYEFGYCSLVEKQTSLKTTNGWHYNLSGRHSLVTRKMLRKEDVLLYMHFYFRPKILFNVQYTSYA